jgi:hypothetical protein
MNIYPSGDHLTTRKTYGSYVTVPITAVTADQWSYSLKY